MQDQRNIWLCLLTKKNFEIVKNTNVYGIPDSSRAIRQIRKAKPGDILVFYLISPVRAIVAIYEVSSFMFKSTKMAPWADRLYPYRIQITHLQDCHIPYSRFTKPIISMGKSMIPMTEEVFSEIMSLSDSYPI